MKCKRRVYESTKYKMLKFDRFSVCVWCRCKRRASVLRASFTISDLNYKCKTLHRGSVQMTWFFWDRVGLRKTEVFMKIKHILFMIQNSSQMQESEEPGYNNGVGFFFITVLWFALLQRFPKLSEISLFMGLEVRFNSSLCCQPWHTKVYTNKNSLWKSLSHL